MKNQHLALNRSYKSRSLTYYKTICLDGVQKCMRKPSAKKLPSRFMPRDGN